MTRSWRFGREDFIDTPVKRYRACMCGWPLPWRRISSRRSRSWTRCCSRRRQFSAKVPWEDGGSQPQRAHRPHRQPQHDDHRGALWRAILWRRAGLRGSGRRIRWWKGMRMPFAVRPVWLSGAGGSSWSREILLTGIELLDGQRQSVAASITGRDAIIRMHYRCAAQKEFRNCRVSVSVNGRKGRTCLCCRPTSWTPPLTLSGTGYVDFIVPELPLTGGAYFLQSHIESNGHAQDWIKNVAQFPVLDADYYGTGNLCPPGWEGNGVLIDYRWSPARAVALPQHLFAPETDKLCRPFCFC